MGAIWKGSHNPTFGDENDHHGHSQLNHPRRDAILQVKGVLYYQCSCCIWGIRMGHFSRIPNSWNEIVVFVAQRNKSVIGVFLGFVFFGCFFNGFFYGFVTMNIQHLMHLCVCNKRTNKSKGCVGWMHFKFSKVGWKEKKLHSDKLR